MPGLMARILSRRADGAPAVAPDPSDVPPADQPTVVVPALGGGQTTGVTRVADAGHPAPAQPEETTAAPRASFRNRSRLRRRLRYLRRVREIGFRDLGGLVFDLDRFGRERPDLVEMKLSGLRAIDSELRALEVALEDEREFEELHEPGLSACSHCGELHGSEARHCPACGVAVGTAPAGAPGLAQAAPAEETPAAAPPTEQPAAEPVAEPIAADVPAEPDPAPQQPAA